MCVMVLLVIRFETTLTLVEYLTKISFMQLGSICAFAFIVMLSSVSALHIFRRIGTSF